MNIASPNSFFFFGEALFGRLGSSASPQVVGGRHVRATGRENLVGIRPRGWDSIHR